METVCHPERSEGVLPVGARPFRPLRQPWNLVPTATGFLQICGFKSLSEARIDFLESLFAAEPVSIIRLGGWFLLGIIPTMVLEIGN
jgi:hypothetical protein